MDSNVGHVAEPEAPESPYVLRSLRPGYRRTKEEMTALRLRACERALLYGDLDYVNMSVGDGLAEAARADLPDATERLGKLERRRLGLTEYEALHGPRSAYDADHPIAVEVAKLTAFLRVGLAARRNGAASDAQSPFGAEQVGLVAEDRTSL